MGIELNMLSHLIGFPSTKLEFLGSDPFSKRPFSQRPFSQKPDSDSLSFSDTVPFSHTGQCPGTVPLALSASPSRNSKRFVLDLPLQLARNLIELTLNRHPSVSTKNRVLTSGEQGVLLYAIDRAGGDWLQAGGHPFFIRGFLADSRQVLDYLKPGPLWQVTGRLSIGDSFDSQIHLYLNSQDLTGATARSPKRRQRHSFAPHLPIMLRIQVGKTLVNASALAELAPGDLVTLDQLSHPQRQSKDRPTELRCGNWSRCCHWIDSRTLIVADTTKSGLDMKKEQNTKNLKVELCEPQEGGGEAGQLEVVVKVEIGQFKMTAAEASNLLPGTLLSLDREVGPEVSLRVGEKLIAKGHLVDYEGQMAVDVSEML